MITAVRNQDAQQPKDQPPLCKELSDVSVVVNQYLTFLVQELDPHNPAEPVCARRRPCSGLIQERLLASFGQCTEHIHPFQDPE